MKKFFSRKSILPDRTNHYDESGHKVDYSYDSLLVRLPGTQNETPPEAHYF